MVLRSALIKLLKEATTQDLHTIKDACSKSLTLIVKPDATSPSSPHDELKGDHTTTQNTTISHVDTTNPPDFQGDNHWLAFELGCDSGLPPRVREMTLDLITKLVNHNIVAGVKQLPSDDANAKKSFLIDRIVSTICESVAGYNSAAEDSVQIQAIKCLLAIVNSPHCKVHHVSLLRIINFCINVYAFSSKPTNHSTSKAALLQVLDVVLSTMEKYAKFSSDDQLNNHSREAPGSVTSMAKLLFG
jgi:hypothetical protein